MNIFGILVAGFAALFVIMLLIARQAQLPRNYFIAFIFSCLALACNIINLIMNFKLSIITYVIINAVVCFFAYVLYVYKKSQW